MTQQLAQGLASFGRGPDTELVHMTKGEVDGLQKLAMSQGGSLTINPNTGLVEAGFLSSLLPMIAGAAAIYFTGGAAAPQIIGGLSNAATIAGGIGAATAAGTGSIKKGIMAGLGAYSGAGLGAGLAEAGAVAPAAQAQTGVASLADTAAGAGKNVLMDPSGGLSQAGKDYVTAVQAQTAPAEAAITNARSAFAAPGNFEQNMATAGKGLTSVVSSPANALNFAKANSGSLLAAGTSILGSAEPAKFETTPEKPGMIRPYTFNRTQRQQPDALTAQYVPGQSTRERQYFDDQYVAGTPYTAGTTPPPVGGIAVNAASGGVTQALRSSPMNSKMAAVDAATAKMSTSKGKTETIQAAKAGDHASLLALQNAGYDMNDLNSYAGGGPVEAMSNANAIGANTGYPMADIHTGAYATPYQQPMSENVVQGAQDSAVDPYTGQATFADGGLSNLGGYSDGGRLLRGPGDGVSDSIPAMIGQKQPARLADGEFVVPARIVSELGNGSTEAGARKLYAMLDRVQNARKKSIGKGKVAANSRADKLLPA